MSASKGVAVVVGAASRRRVPVSGSSPLARSLSRLARPHPHHRLGTDGDALLGRAMEIAADDTDDRQTAILQMLLDELGKLR